ncbi:MAG: carboxymuconolactone decarboxylase family protein [Ilumatobacteraceae bacterium]
MKRISPHNLLPAGTRAVMALHQAVHDGDLEPLLLELVYTRASQINGCAFCLDMHTKDARARGETEQRLYALTAWRETNFYSDRECAALALTEAVTRLTEEGVSDAVYDAAAAQFNDKELAELIFAISAINVWNRLNVTARTVPGSYVSPHKPA